MCNTSHRDAAYFYHIWKLINNMTKYFYKTDNIRMNVTWRPVRVNTAATEKQNVLHIPSVCVCVAFVILSAKRMNLIIL